MTYQATMQDGTVVFDDDKRPENGAKLRVEIVDSDGSVSQIGERLLKWAGCIKEGPADASANLDHYLYGLPKK